MKKCLIVVAFVAASCFAFSEVDPRINTYNEFFEKKDYVRALVIAESVIASFPDVLEFHREKAKMLAATNQTEKFMEEMLLIRNSQNPGNIQCFFAALSHDLVSTDLRDDLRRLFFQRKDTEILFSWPQFSTDKVVVVSKVYSGKEFSNEDYSPISPRQPDAQVPIFQEPGEEAEKKACLSNMKYLTGAIELYNFDHSPMLTSIDSSTIPMLITQGYLKKNITLPTPQCAYYSHGDVSDSGVVACSFHGPCSEPDDSEFSQNGSLSKSNLYQDSLAPDYANYSAGQALKKIEELNQECEKILPFYPESRVELFDIIKELQLKVAEMEKLKDSKEQKILAKKWILNAIARRELFIKKWNNKRF